MESKAVDKWIWTTPELLVFGNIADLTLARNKDAGTGDAFTFQNQLTRLSG
jgi:hypothetical protein